MKRRIKSIIASAMTALLLVTDVGSFPVVWAAEPEEINEESGKDKTPIISDEIANEDAIGISAEEAAVSENDMPAHDSTGRNEEPEFENAGDVEYKYYKPYDNAAYSLRYYVMDDYTICIAGISGTASGTLVISNKIDGKIVTTIGDRAFVDCNGFTGSLTIPNSVMTIGDSAFYHCTGFTGNLVIPNSVTTIGDGAFACCYGFTGSLTISNGVTTIGAGAFSGCKFTGSLTIPNGVTTIGTQAFYSCKGFTGSLIIPNSVTTIGDSAFYYCTGFTGNLVIPNSVTTIGDEAFAFCYGFTGSLTISNGVTTIGDGAFACCYGFTGSLTIPNGVTTIGTQAFYSCEGFTGSLTIPNGVTTIGNCAFAGCGGFTGSLTIPAGVTSLGYYMILDTGISNVTIPSTVTNSGYCVNDEGDLTGALTGCTTLKEVVFAKGIKKIPDYICYAVDSIEKVVIPPSVVEIGIDAFYKCDKMTIYCTAGSYAKQYAKDNNIPYVIDEGDSPMNPVVSVCEDTTEMHLVKGQKFTLAESGWVSSDKSILSISRTNLMTAKKVTSTPVKLTNNEKSIDVYITQPKMVAKTITLQVGNIHAIGFNYDRENLGVQWCCNTPDIATVNADGEVTAVGKGTATITAYVNGSAYTCKVKVEEDIPAVDRTIHMTLQAKKTISIKGVKKVTWVSDDEDIVSVTKKNKITANAIGETILRTEYEGTEYRIRVFVENPAIISKSILSSGKNKYKLTLPSGTTADIEFASVVQPVIFKSNKGEIAYVNADGTIVTNRKGTAKLTAKINGKTITITVTVE